MSPLIDLALVAMNVAYGFWLRGWLDRRRHQREWPYTYRWQCRHCTQWVDIKGTGPAGTAVLIERIDQQHDCGRSFV